MTSSTSSSSSSSSWSSGKGLIPQRDVLGPLFLMLSTPPFSIVFYHVVSQRQGDFVAFGKDLLKDGLFQTLYSIWPSPWVPGVWKAVLAYAALQLVLMKVVPGRDFVGTVTQKGVRPVYKANGMACFLITMFLLLLGAWTEVIQPALLYDYFGHILSTMNVFALAFCAMLYVKGHVAPSGPDSGSNGSLIQDFYWGMELYPRILGWDVKLFTNCRMGMMFWAVAICSFCFKNMELNQGSLSPGLAASVAIQMVYISKFFYWEMGYMCSMDIQHDRAGYYICWGCLVWVPAVYTSQAFYLTTNGPELSVVQAMLIFAAGFACVAINYDSDRQRYVFRQTNGKCLIWGREPRKIVAKYKTADGKLKESLLLLDGWWMISRHFHYVPEILASFFWSLPAGMPKEGISAVLGPYFYVIYLTILLTDRAWRDDDQCRTKYGKYWDQYCEHVPYKILPGIL